MPPQRFLYLTEQKVGNGKKEEEGGGGGEGEEGGEKVSLKTHTTTRGVGKNCYHDSQANALTRPSHPPDVSIPKWNIAHHILRGQNLMCYVQKVVLFSGMSLQL